MRKSIADKDVVVLTKEIDRLKKIASDLEDILPEKTPQIDSAKKTISDAITEREKEVVTRFKA
ncbi:TPA: hypothetical protein MDC20_001531 [Morganella morganii]|uniref:hypothetical protein n=1 Tax=Morganella morganii TaxID=582 RepID=UPI000F58F3EA|nr:hypothetical protein [Morganella morganii]WHZ55004.1 hypothetical protein QLX58_06955 [Morganella morganii]HBU8230914.1 hypothetical protein [Morganella morganii]